MFVIIQGSLKASLLGRIIFSGCLPNRGIQGNQGKGLYLKDIRENQEIRLLPVTITRNIYLCFFNQWIF